MSTVAPEPVVLVARRDHVVEITINRPQAMNAVDAAVSALIGRALAEAEADTSTRAVVLAAAGTRAFSAGADLKAIARGEMPFDPEHPEWGFAGYVNQVVSVPTIAAVEGFALGGGTELAMASDLVVAGRSAAFGLPEVRRGIMPGGGGTVRITRQLPEKRALELLLTGEPVDAETMLRWGLVNKVVPDSDAATAARALAERIAECAPLAVRASKRVALGIEDGARLEEASRWKAQEAEARRIGTSEDAREGTAAFLEKRPPHWRGA